MTASPTIGRVVIFRSRTGRYSVPAIVTATDETLEPAGVRVYEESFGERGVPGLSDAQWNVHLTVFTPGLPGQRANAEDFIAVGVREPSENVAGAYQEWDVPMGAHDGPDQEPGTWRWPVIR